MCAAEHIADVPEQSVTGDSRGGEIYKSRERKMCKKYEIEIKFNCGLPSDI